MLEELYTIFTNLSSVLMPYTYHLLMAVMIYFVILGMIYRPANADEPFPSDELKKSTFLMGIGGLTFGLLVGLFIFPYFPSVLSILIIPISGLATFFASMGVYLFRAYLEHYKKKNREN